MCTVAFRGRINVRAHFRAQTFHLAKAKQLQYLVRIWSQMGEVWGQSYQGRINTKWSADALTLRSWHFLIAWRIFYKYSWQSEFSLTASRQLTLLKSRCAFISKPSPSTNLSSYWLQERAHGGSFPAPNRTPLKGSELLKSDSLFLFGTYGSILNSELSRVQRIIRTHFVLKDS